MIPCASGEGNLSLARRAMAAVEEPLGIGAFGGGEQEGLLLRCLHALAITSIPSLLAR